MRIILAPYDYVCVYVCVCDCYVNLVPHQMSFMHVVAIVERMFFVS